MRDSRLAAPANGKTAAFVAAQAVRWIGYGLNVLTFSLVGLTLVLVGVALLAGDRVSAVAGRLGGRGRPRLCDKGAGGGLSRLRP